MQSEVQTKRERRDYSLLQFCNSYCKPSLAAEHEVSCKATTAIAVEKEAGFCKIKTANAVKMAVEKEAGLCKKTTAIAVEKEAGSCKKSIDAFNKTMALEVKSCKKSIADAVNVEKEKESTWCKKNSVMIEKVGPFKPSRKKTIGEIKKYYHNYEISMDLRFAESDLQRNNPNSQILQGIV